jgi:hypothetical protein
MLPAPSFPAVRRHALPLGLALLAAVPVAFIALRVADAARNIPFWDEFDGVLAFLLRLDTGVSWGDFFARVFSLDSEHRTVVSRLIVAATFGLTGEANFNLLAAIGNLSFVAMAALLVSSAAGLARRVRLGVILAFGLFHLQHYETFLWSGASIDHFMVLMMAAGAFTGLAQGGRFATAGAGLFGVLATFTLAHGLVVWPLGAALLWTAGRRRACALWAGLAAATLLFYFQAFHIDEAHAIRDFSAAGIGRLVQFWLALLGGPLAFGERALAPGFGLALLGLLGWLGARGAGRRQPAAMAMALFAAGALALIAFGRIEVAPAHIQSRYLVLGSLAWSLAIFLLIEEGADEARPWRLLAWSLPALAAFNLASNLESHDDANTFLWSRDYPAVRFKQYGDDGHAGPFRLHPDKDTAKRLLTQAAARGIYELPRFCHEAQVPAPVPNPAMVTYVTDLTADGAAVGFEGWAMLPGRRSRRGEIHVLLRSETRSIVLTTFPVARPDVAKAMQAPLWHHCGYNFVIKRERLPRENFQIGLILTDGVRSELKLTGHWLNLAPAAPAAQ